MNEKTGAQGGANEPPALADVAHLKPRLGAGAAYTSVTLAAVVIGLGLTSGTNAFAYAAGQVVLAFSFVHAFVLLHEAGHDTLFPWRGLNRVVGHVAAFLAVIPFWNWQRIHARHHHYAGWQDLDATTASLVPRPIRPWERRIIDAAWAAWIPMFAVTYRIQNFWNLPRVARYVSNPANLRRIRINTLALVVGYGAVLFVIGPLTLLKLIGPGFLLGLVAQESLILSQHTHVPQRLSMGETVRPFSPLEQEPFTRSLRLPGWLSTALMHFDAHELHHMYPHVPGYQLRRIDYKPTNEVNWWAWLKSARGLKGTDFLFSNWDRTGIRV